MTSRQLNNLILKWCETYEQPCLRLSLSFWLSECHQVIAYRRPSSLLLITLHCLIPCCFCSLLPQPDWWEQGPVSSSWTHVSEAALWENSDTDLLDYAWGQVTRQVLHNEIAIEMPFTTQVRPVWQNMMIFGVWNTFKFTTNFLASCCMEEMYGLKCKKIYKWSNTYRVKCVVLFFVLYRRHLSWLCLLWTRTTKQMFVITLITKGIWLHVSAFSFDGALAEGSILEIHHPLNPLNPEFSVMGVSWSLPQPSALGWDRVNLSPAPQSKTSMWG